MNHSAFANIGVQQQHQQMLQHYPSHLDISDDDSSSSLSPFDLRFNNLPTGDVVAKKVRNQLIRPTPEVVEPEITEEQG